MDFHMKILVNPAITILALMSCKEFQCSGGGVFYDWFPIETLLLE
jgi:hypothetical protein